MHDINNHSLPIDCILSVIRGFRNGIITGARIRIPYLLQAAVYAVIFDQGRIFDKIKFVLKQLFIHGKNLGLFVAIYKSICCILRNFGISGGVESWIAGLVGGYWAFGDSKGISGAVNNQIVLYLFARGIQGIIITGAKQGYVPKPLDVSTPRGFRYLAAFSLALILYLTEYQPQSLNKGFVATMDYLYYQSDSGKMLAPIDYKFLPTLILGTISLLYPIREHLGLEQILDTILGK